MYKQGIFEKVRFDTSKGPLTMEQLPDLSDEELIVLENTLKAEVKASKKSNRFSKVTTKDKKPKLKLAIVSDIIDTIIANRNEESNAGEIKRKNNEIDEVIARKKSAELEDMSIEELEKMRK